MRWFMTALLLPMLATAGDLRRQELDHVGAYNFRVEISGVAAGFFKGVDGLSTSAFDSDDAILGDTIVLRDGVRAGTWATRILSTRPLPVTVTAYADGEAVGARTVMICKRKGIVDRTGKIGVLTLERCN